MTAKKDSKIALTSSSAPFELMGDEKITWLVVFDDSIVTQAIWQIKDSRHSNWIEAATSSRSMVSFALLPSIFIFVP